MKHHNAPSVVTDNDLVMRSEVYAALSDEQRQDHARMWAKRMTAENRELFALLANEWEAEDDDVE